MRGLLLPLLMAFLMSACGDSVRDVNDFGIPSVQIQLSSEQLGLLNGQIQSKRPVSADLSFNGKGRIQCDISHSGQSSLFDFRKSYNLRACNGHPLGKTVFRLNALNRDRTKLRPGLAYQAFQILGLPTPDNELVAAYMNQTYIGLYARTTPITQELLAGFGIKSREIYQAKFGNAGFRKSFASREGEAFDYEGSGEDNFLYIRRINEILWGEMDEARFVEQIEAVLDTSSFLNYSAAALYTEHWDGFDNNYFLIFDRNRNKIVTAPWDLDRVWEQVNAVGPAQLLERNWLLQRLLRNEGYKAQFLASLDRLRAELPLEILLEQSRVKQEKVGEAFRHDPILSVGGEEVYEQLRTQLTNWNAQIEAYRAAQ